MAGADGLKPIPQLDGRGLPVGYAYQPDYEVTPREAKAMLAAKGGPDGALLVDCRRQNEWETCRIEGAVLIPMEEIAMRLDELERSHGDRDRTIIVQCHTGRRSLKVTHLLREAGFADVKSMAGGIELWSLDIDPSVPRY